MLRRVAKDYGWTARQFWEHTPKEILALFTKPANQETGSSIQDRDKLLQQHNERRAARGLYPVVPSWFLPGLRSK